MQSIFFCKLGYPPIVVLGLVLKLDCSVHFFFAGCPVHGCFKNWAVQSTFGLSWAVQSIVVLKAGLLSPYFFKAGLSSP